MSIKRADKRPAAWLGLMPLVYLTLAVAAVAIVARSGIYPSGDDVLYHLHRMEWVYRSVGAGDWWPAYDPSWYNGVEILRYFPPLTPYFMAACQWAAGGDPFNGYLVFVGLVCYLGALSWLYIGWKMERPALGAFLGALWFFVPGNLFALFSEGDLPRALGMVFLPLFLYNVMSYLWTARWKYLPGVAICLALMAICHAGCAGMLALATLLYLVLYVLLNRGSLRAAGRIFLALLLGFALDGIWLLPSLAGGVANVAGGEAMARFFQSLRLTLWPFGREGGQNATYFGLSLFAVALLGVFLSKRAAAPSFAACVLICLSTSSALYPLLSKLPGGQYLRMLRFLPIAAGLCLLSLLKWDRLKRLLLVLFCALFALDCVPFLRYAYGIRTGRQPAERFDETWEYALLNEAQEITSQRLVVLNEGATGAIDPYLSTDWGEPTDNTFGTGWEAAATARNIQMLDRAANGGDYLYLFDRAMELGNDTVLVRNAVLLSIEEAPLEELDAAAERVGYVLVDSSDAFRLYHLQNVPERWGTASDYRALNIATHPGMALSFPGVEETADNNLDHYTFEQLSQYDMVYIGDFTCDDKAHAEEMILRLSESGTRVVIVADGIPEDKKTHYQEFLGVTCNGIQFSNGYPEMSTIDGRLFADMFPRGYTEWRTVYIDGLDDVWGELYDNGLTLDFYGTVANEDLVFIALNLPYFHELTHDPSVGALLSRALRLPEDELPVRRIVPLTVETGGDHITVVSPEDGVNTAIAFQGSFVSDAPVYAKNNLTYVGAGTTHLTVVYPYLKEGAAVSALALIGTAVLAAVDRRREKRAAERRTAEAALCAAEETQ